MTLKTNSKMTDGLYDREVEEQSGLCFDDAGKQTCASLSFGCFGLGL